ncbi:citrate/tricarballylate utilization protein [Alicyclobacillus sacchari]|uniref:Citrate/tricarballylate utilization protein n=1 Tax=Alicyclobacillus sacchari TaxID=392010 RepID=A0A4R8LJK3_9BACL|nr:tricarballylate utilization 4Fe-4S protein TcuB [Alicyclobacillus sacchari]TDY43995.1 citrate/tricarballylate utilization protein [Alicyclobacillus sacchari]GMA58238.1 tricarballylate utilization protein B [Alicyclobacillus sacchari]
MSHDELMEEGKRQMRVCNACRYCEGFCAVWRAIEWRRDVQDGDLAYFANLCHDCKECVFACPFAPPHEFGVNPPRLFASLRQASYRKYAWPGPFARALKGRSGYAWAAIGSVVLLCLISLVANGSLFGVRGAAFYAVLPESVLEVVFGMLAVWLICGWLVGAWRFWSDIRAVNSSTVQVRDILRAARYAMSLRYLGGSEDEPLSRSRKWFHHCVVYGFLLDFASTCLAAYDSHILHEEAPYPVGSPVVLLGIIGGAGLLVGCAGLLFVKVGMNRDTVDEGAYQSGRAFLWTMLLVAASGLLLLLLRSTTVMAEVLVIHLSFVAALFFTAPYSKFGHFVYRCLALVRYAEEERKHHSPGH